MADIVANVFAGLWKPYVGPVGEALPGLNDLAPPAITVTPAGNWVAVGFTIENFSLEVTTESQTVWANEQTVPIDEVLLKEMGVLKFNLLENNLTAWNSALASISTLSTTAAGANQTAQDKLGVGGVTGGFTKKALIMLGANQAAGSRLVHIYKAVTTGATYASGKEVGSIAVNYKLVGDPSQTAGERLFKVWDITAVASS